MSDAPIIAKWNTCLALETEHKRLRPARVRAGVEALLSDLAKGTYFLAETGGTPAGQLLITCEWSDWRNGSFWWLQSVYVAKEFRGNGIFRALLNHVHGLAKAQKDVCGLRLYMDAHNAKAREAYGRLGWEKTNYEIFEINYES